jgi:hypothetical protein
VEGEGRIQLRCGDREDERDCGFAVELLMLKEVMVVSRREAIARAKAAILP